MKKVILMLLALIMVLSSFVACSDGGKKEESETKEQTSTPKDEEESETNSPYVDTGLPEGLNYGDSEVNVIGWNPEQPEFEVKEDELDGEPILDSIYKRNLYTEQLLGVKLNFVIVEGNGNDDQIKKWCDTVKNMMTDPNTPVDIFACYSRTAAVATVNGLNQDVTQYENLDLSKEWWPENIKEEFKIGDKLYFLTGDISTNVLHMMFCIFYNNSLVSKYGLESPVELVRNREWTIDRFVTMTSDIYEDLDDIPGKSLGDFFGATFEYFQADCLLQGAGFKIVKATNEYGKYLEINEDFFGEKFGSVVNKLGDWSASDGVYNDGGYTGETSKAFLDGRSVFQIHKASFGFDIQNTDIDYGIVPPPMLDPDTQKSYTTSLANPYTIYSIGRETKDGEKAAAVLQTLGYYGMKYTTPAIFDVTFKGKFSKAEEVSEMFNLVRKSVGFDLGILYMKKLQYICDYPTHEAILPNKNWEVVMNRAIVKVLNVKMKKLNEELKAIIEAN